jgi:hypothetical protein
MSFVLKIRNTTSATAYLPQYRYALGWCPSGVLLSSVSDPDRIALGVRLSLQWWIHGHLWAGRNTQLRL